MTTEYIARVCTRRGKLKFQSKPHDTREAAAKEAFGAIDWARDCSTGYGYNGSFDIRYHRRDSIMTDRDPGYVDPGEHGRACDMRKFALVSSQGTACAETVLSERENTPEWRARIEGQFCNGKPDDPLPGTWTDVTDNEAV